MLDARAPFVLLDDARATSASPARLYRNPIEIVTCDDPREIAATLKKLEGSQWAGFLCYEAGHALEPKLANTARATDLPLLWFGRFEGYEEYATGDIPSLLPDSAGAWAGEPRPSISRRAHADTLAKVQALINAGDIYQANLTFQTEIPIAGDPLALYAGLRHRARAGYGGVIWTGTDWLLSLSPELFFALRNGKITTKPMKGTASRGATPDSDNEAIQSLASDPKQRAENLMIVDLLRNDLSRIAAPGSVEVPHLFTVETYPTVHQMTSTVTAQSQQGISAGDILAAIFPCGSITGAPKIRAMEVISEFETGPRGIYTGAIGRIDASGDAAFNVAIRTLQIRDGETRASLGLGSGIVADSNPHDEWDECLAKGRFVADPRRIDLIETMRFDPGEGIALLELHLARMGESARALGFSFDRHAARNALQAATFRLEAGSTVRMRLARAGDFAIETRALPAPIEGPVSTALRPLPLAPSDFRLRHKTSDRTFYEKAKRDAGTFEVIFVDADGLVTEGSFTSVFIERGGKLLTPPTRLSLLPGVFRASLIQQGRAFEEELRPVDLQDGFLIGNARRGLISAAAPK